MAMKIVLSLDVHRLRQCSEHGVEHFEKRVSLEGKYKCWDREISLGGMARLTEATGTLRLLGACQAPELNYDPASSVGRLFIMEEQGDWQVTAVVVLNKKRHNELWDRLKHDRNLRFAKLLLVSDKIEPGRACVRFNAKDVFNIEAVEIEFLHEFTKA
ncbi:MAG: hypothetical protein ACE5ER_01940 [Nitrospinaceae bacterium]